MILFICSICSYVNKVYKSREIFVFCITDVPHCDDLKFDNKFEVPVM
jgi:hypothetical protein